MASSEETKPLCQSNGSPLRTSKILWASTAVTILILSTVLLTFPVLFRGVCPTEAINRQETRIPQLHCGSSPAEAQNRSCVFDLMASAWVPQECHQPALEQKYLTSRHWEFSQDKKRDVLLDADELGHGDRVVWWTSNEFHFAHCLYTWERWSQAVENGLPVDDQILDRVHTAHCSKMMRDPNVSSSAFETMVKLAYFSCIYV